MTSFRQTLAAVGLGLALATVATPAQAQFSLGIAGGGTAPSGSLNTTQDMGYNGLVAVQFGVPLIPFKIRADVQYNSFGGANFSSAVNQAAAGTDARVISGSVNAVLPLLPGPIKPYLIAGYGYYDTRFGGTNAANTRKAGYNYGAGIKVTKLFIEARVHNVPNSAFNVANGQTTSTFIPVSVGFMF